jgi:hypothetical protein
MSEVSREASRITHSAEEFEDAEDFYTGRAGRCPAAQLNNQKTWFLNNHSLQTSKHCFCVVHPLPEEEGTGRTRGERNFTVNDQNIYRKKFESVFVEN